MKILSMDNASLCGALAQMGETLRTHLGTGKIVGLVQVDQAKVAAAFDKSRGRYKVFTITLLR